MLKIPRQKLELGTESLIGTLASPRHPFLSPMTTRFPSKREEKRKETLDWA